MFQSESGQSTVEYAVVAAVLVVVVSGLAAIVSSASDGALLNMDVLAGSHSVSSLGGTADVLFF